jgi:vancomycin resistance protein YoaR
MTPVIQPIKAKPLKMPGLWLPVLLVLIAGGLLVIMLFITLAYQVLYMERVYPGIVAAGIEAGGLTRTELMAAIEQRTSAYLAGPVVVQFGGQTWRFTGQELGMRLDVLATANAAYDIGRSGNFIADMLTHLSLLSTPRQLDPIIQYDTGPTNQVLQSLAERINHLPQDARLTITPDARVQVTPATYGQRLHVEATQPLIEAALFTHSSQPVQPIVQQVAPALTDVNAARRQAENLLAVPLIFYFEENGQATEWQLKPENLATVLRAVQIVNAAGRPEVTIEINRSKLTPYLEQMAAAINRPVVEAQLKFNADTGQLIVLQPSQTGRALDVETTYQRILALKDQPNQRIELPLAITAPVVASDNLANLGIKELVSESTSYFKGSSESRMQNIALAASKFDGVIIPPGGVFSFNEHLGEVTKEAGFNESLIIQGNRTSVGLGGGVCQVSTTAFRAAFYGGFEIVERWAHGYRVGWYEINSVPGLDATVYSPDLDFRFRNDTDYYMLIQTESDLLEGTVTFRFYSTNTGREVTISEPETTNLVKHGPPLYEPDPSLPKGVTKQVDWAVDGLDVRVNRIVKQGDQVLHQDEIFSHYTPWRAVYKVGPASQVIRPQ